MNSPGFSGILAEIPAKNKGRISAALVQKFRSTRLVVKSFTSFSLLSSFSLELSSSFFPPELGFY
jgi:hypothetical protein